MCKSISESNKAAPGANAAATAPPPPPPTVITIRNSVTKNKTFSNPLNNPVQATALLQTRPAPTTQQEFDKERPYFIFVPKKLATDFFNAPVGSKPTSKVSLFFGVEPEMSLFRLREFFADETNSILITIPGVEGGWAGIPIPFGYGISTSIIDDLMTEAGLSGISYTVEVMAGYSTGYRGVSLTVINQLVNLSSLKRLIYLDAWYHYNDHPLMPAASPYFKRNTLFAIDTAMSKSASLQLVIYAFTHPGGVPRSNPGQTDNKIEDPPSEPVATLITKYPGKINFIDFEFKFQTRPAIDDALEKICLARLIQFGIAASKFSAASVSVGLIGLVNALPVRGSLGMLGLAGFTDIYTWVTGNTAVINAFSIIGAMSLVTTHNLLNLWTTNSHYEMRHRMFVIELGKEPLVP
jgi:hypothetical protein